MRDPSRLRSVLDLVPAELRDAVAAILSREDSVCCPIAELPGGHDQAVVLDREGWGVIWALDPLGPSVTLTPWASARLEVAIAERVTVRSRDGSYRDDAGRKVKLTMREIEEWPEWRGLGEIPQVRIPRATGFVPLPEPHLVPVQPDPEPARSSIAGQVAILGRVVALLRPSSRRRKRKARKARPA